MVKKRTYGKFSWKPKYFQKWWIVVMECDQIFKALSENNWVHLNLNGTVQFLSDYDCINEQLLS